MCHFCVNGRLVRHFFIVSNKAVITREIVSIYSAMHFMYANDLNNICMDTLAQHPDQAKNFPTISRLTDKITLTS